RADDEAVGDVEQEKLGHSRTQRTSPALPSPCSGEGSGGGINHSRRQAGHCRVQPVSLSGGEGLSPGMTVSTLNKSSGSPPRFVSASPTNAEVISWWSPAPALPL